jgi:hypothetical protein
MVMGLRRSRGWYLTAIYSTSCCIVFRFYWTNPITTAGTTTTLGQTVAIFPYEQGDLNVIVPDTLDDIYISVLKPLMPEKESGAPYVIPDETTLLDFEHVVLDMMKDDTPCQYINLRSLTNKYRIGTFTDRANRRTYCILATTSAMYPWGNVIVDTDPATAKNLSFVVPHPQHDLDTGEQGIRLLKGTTSRSWIVAGSYRRAYPIGGKSFGLPWIGKGGTCQDQYPLSDAAHALSGLHYATAAIHLYYNSVVEQDYTSVSLHGMANTSCGVIDTFMTHGSCMAPASLANDSDGGSEGGGDNVGREGRIEKINILKQMASAHSNDAGVHAIPSDGYGCTLCGATNIQGRLINGVAPDRVCDTFASSYNMQFIHIEQKLEYRRTNKEQFWIDVFNSAYPQFSVR